MASLDSARWRNGNCRHVVAPWRGTHAVLAVATNNLDWLRARHAEGTLNNQVTDVGGFVSLAVRLDRPEALTLLLELGFDPDERMDTTGRGGKPLEYCAKTRRTDLAEILLRHGA